MALDEDALKNRSRLTPGTIRREDEIDFQDLIYGMAESVADAQTKLDYNLAESMTRFAETKVAVIPRVVRTIRPDGSVVDEPDKPVERSLLELGITPERYQFSEATLDVEFDLSFATDETDTSEEKKRARFRVDTSEAHHRRRYHGEANTTAKISARLVPVPTPPSFGPATVEGGTTDEGTDTPGTEPADEDETGAESSSDDADDDSAFEPADTVDDTTDETDS
jgi:hypothetical protein